MQRFHTMLLWLPLALGVACDDDDGPSYCRDAVCECDGAIDCDIECPLGGCDVSCHDADHCDTRCDDDCDVSCRGTPACNSACGDDCSFTCSSVADCDLQCGEDCDVDCHSVSSCRAKVGARSVVECRSLSSCDIECIGPCEVACVQVSACNVRCTGEGLMLLGEGDRLGCDYTSPEDAAAAPKERD